MASDHTRTIIPALGLNVKSQDGWSNLKHKFHPSEGWFNWKKAPFYIEFDRGLGNRPRAKYEKIVFQEFSFVEDLKKGVPPNISIDENQIISREEISEDEYHKNFN